MSVLVSKSFSKFLLGFPGVFTVKSYFTPKFQETKCRCIDPYRSTLCSPQWALTTLALSHKTGYFSFKAVMLMLNCDLLFWPKCCVLLLSGGEGAKKRWSSSRRQVNLFFFCNSYFVNILRGKPFWCLFSHICNAPFITVRDPVCMTFYFSISSIMYRHPHTHTASNPKCMMLMTDFLLCTSGTWEKVEIFQQATTLWTNQHRDYIILSWGMCLVCDQPNGKIIVCFSTRSTKKCPA